MSTIVIISLIVSFVGVLYYALKEISSIKLSS